MKSLDITGKTLEDALNKALKELNVTKDKIEYEILEEGSKGFLSIIGSKPYKIRVIVKRDYIAEGKKFLNDVLNSMEIKAEVEITEQKDVTNINLSGDKVGLIIGYRGETLDSLQYLVSLVINKGHETVYKRVVLDAENYRMKREETLKRVAQKTAYKVRKNGRLFKLEPMNPYERRIIHAALQDDNSVTTSSEGEEPYRRVVVDIKR